MAKIIKKEKIPHFIAELGKERQVYAPVEKGGEYTIEPVAGSSAEEVRLDYPTTILSPKKIFFPPEEILFESEGDKIDVPDLREEKVLFGLHLCDAHSLLLMDEFLNHGYEDYYYSSRRESTLVICVDHQAKGPVFSETLGLDARSGYDLILKDHGDVYTTIPGSEEGSRLLEAPFFDDNGAQEDLDDKKPEGIYSDISRLSRAVERGRDSRVWTELAEACFCCGICSYVCPVCYCFETRDQLALNLKSGYRERRWDACFLPDFAKVAGFDFRKTLQSRMYHWYWHKFVQIPAIFGRIGCVGCGRCMHYCPAKIDYREVVKTLIEELDDEE
jgi:sulfhydrogenase subunit beta (sulfur reductase)